MRNTKARTVALTGMLFALAMALSFLESTITPLLGLMPAVKIGLANIVVMYALLYLGKKQAWTLMLLKAVFAFMTRGVTAGFLSLCGGALSLLVLCLLLVLPVRVTGYIFSASGALAHNLGQLAGASLLLSSDMVWGYAPILVISGLIVGYLTFWIFKEISPYLSNALGQPKNEVKNKFKKKS